MVEIVSYSEALRDRIIDLILTIQRDEFGFDIRAEDQPDLLNIANFYQTGSGGFWVALSDGDVVGTIALRDIGNNQGALRKMFVKDTHRGGKTSVAFRLLERPVQSAATARVKDLYLGTTERFVAAHRFYEKNGFSRIAMELLPAAFPRMPLDTRFYHRALA
jgi:N-acetylglutamate synthase-like GNAT family acetyltransferase